MILLITEGRPGALQSVLSRIDPTVASHELKASLSSPAFGAVLEDDGLEIAVIECCMNVHGCLELLKNIKRRRSDVPVIFVSSSASDQAAMVALNCGARYCFRKPLDVLQFKEQLRTLLALKRASREQRVPLLFTDSKPAEAAGTANDIPESVLRAMHFIEDHAGEREFSVERLAGIACMSPFHFCRVFKKHTKKSPMQYVNQVRIDKAKEFLISSSGNMSVSLIANTLGFCDSSNFNKHFKKSTGLTPSAFKLNSQVPLPK